MKSKKTNKTAIVIGGGIHGMTSALELAKKGVGVTVLEKKPSIMSGTSNATHNRAHMGYHYPRSVETAEECLRGLSFFKKNFSAALNYPGKSYYLLERSDSKTSAKDFEKFCKKIKIPYQTIKEDDLLWNKKNIECGFCVPEPIFNVDILRKLLKKEANRLGINIVTNSEVTGFLKKDNVYEIITGNKSKTKKYTADIILNATYAHTNSILKILGLEQDMTEYELQKTEVVVVKSSKKLPALTVMDGNFISLMPLAGTKNKYLVYDVTHSVVHRKNGFFLGTKKTHPTNFGKMVKHGKKYFPFMDQLEFIKSNYGFRPIPLDITGDSRKTRLVQHQKHQNIYSIFEGKFISAPLIAGELVKLMKKNKTI